VAATAANIGAPAIAIIAASTPIVVLCEQSGWNEDQQKKKRPFTHLASGVSWQLAVGGWR